MNFPESSDLNRLLYLYSESNADEEDTIAFWKRMLQLYANENHTLLINPEEFTHSFIVNGIFPTSFTIALGRLQREDVLLPQNKLPSLPGDNDETLNSNSNQGGEDDEGLITSLISTVWTIGQGWLSNVTASSNSTNQQDTGPFVNVDVLKQMETIIVEHAKSKDESELVFTRLSLPGFAFQFNDFVSQALSNPATTTSSSSGSTHNQQLLQILSADSFALDDTKLTILLQWMYRNKTVQINGDIVQILVPSNNNTISPVKSSKKAKQPLSFYVSLLRVRVSIYKIEEKIKELEKKMQDHKLKAIQAKSAGNENAALLQLKIRKMTEEQMKKLIGAQHSLEHSLLNMESSLMNMEIVDAYKAAASGLKVTRQENGVSIDSVEDAIEQFESEMDEMKDINDALTNQSALSSGEEMELEEELEALMKASPPIVSTPAKGTVVAAPSVASSAKSTAMKPSIDGSLPIAPTKLPPIATPQKPVVTVSEDPLLKDLESRLAML